MIAPKKITFGIALGSGGARGLAHIGVLEVLEKEGIEIDYIVGSSAGAMIGAWYALNKDIAQVHKTMCANNWRNIATVMFDPSLKRGIISGNKMKEFLTNQLSLHTFAETKIPVAAIATDFKTGASKILKTGKLIDAVMASGAIPLIFEPYKIGREYFMDGGMSQPVPAPAARSLGMDVVLAVNLDGDVLDGKMSKGTSLIAVAEHSFNIFRYQLSAKDAAAADITIAPKTKIKSLIGWSALLKPEVVVESGRRAMRMALPELRQLLWERQKIAL